MNIFLNKDGIGFSLSYRVGQKIDGSYSIMRGWTSRAEAGGDTRHY